MMTYVEGNSLHPERGGASTFARYAFNELWSFIAGWAILLDYLIVMAIAAFSISHYLAALLGRLGRRAVTEHVIAAAAIAFVAVLEHPRAAGGPAAVRARASGCSTSSPVRRHPGWSALAQFWDPGAITDSIHLGSAPELGRPDLRSRRGHGRADRHRGGVGAGRRGAGRTPRRSSGSW